MGATPGWCVRAALLAMMMGALVSSMLPACQFPEYGMSSAAGGNAGAASTGGGSGDLGGTLNEAGDAGNDAGANAGMAGAAGMEEPPPPCAQECVAQAPSGWHGPMAFWEGMASTTGKPPDCPAGYADPTDLHRELIAPPGACTCSCSAVGQECDVGVRLYSDLACTSACSTIASTRMCSAVSGCSGSQGSMRVDPPTISGGTCKDEVTEIPPPSWQYNDRLCVATSPGSCEDPRKVCAPTPRVPYNSQLCITRGIFEGQAPPPCPAAYPNAYKPLYTEFTDNRKCSDCTCGSVSGGSCSGSILLSEGNDCSSGADLSLSGNCQTFNLGPGNIQPSRILGKFEVKAGSCGVATPSKPTGSATASGNFTVVCCQ